MKKTLALLLAIVISAIAICTLTVSAFAAPEAETPAPDAGAADSADKNDAADADKNEAADTDKEENKEENKEEDKKEEETKATEAAPTLPGVQLPDALKPTQPTTVPATEKPADKETEKATDPTKAPETSLAGTEVVTLPEGVTSIDEGPTSTTKAPAKVDNVIPDTGSGVVVPAVALLVLAAGTVAVVKTKKD